MVVKRAPKKLAKKAAKESPTKAKKGAVEVKEELYLRRSSRETAGKNPLLDMRRELEEIVESEPQIRITKARKPIVKRKLEKSLPAEKDPEWEDMTIPKIGTQKRRPKRKGAGNILKQLEVDGE